MFAGDKRALARLMTYIDNRHDEALAIMGEAYNRSGRSLRLGVTGPPGAGKSTLVDKLIRGYRAQGKQVGVIAIDPSSPFTGGAVLGDRIRMQDHNADEGVFIRSLGSRGAHGGLSRATRDIAHLLDAFGMDVIVIETVGVGQTELDIMDVAHTTLVVLVPESGDTIQTMKAGLMEIADIFIVNQADREGADRIFAELRALSEMHSQGWEVPVLKTVAVKGEGLGEILTTVAQHQAHCQGKARQTGHAATAREEECLTILASEIHARVKGLFTTNKAYHTLRERLIAEKINPYEAVKELLGKMRFS
jgi:LAO/AO transport system kinase